MNHYNEFIKANPVFKERALFTLTGDSRAAETLHWWSGRACDTNFEQWNDAWGELFILMSETLKNTGD